MKKAYEKPESFVENFKATDVLTTSSPIDDRDPADNDIPFGE